MSTEEERQANTANVYALIEMAAGENHDAFKYLQEIAFVARIVDDLIDRDREASAAEVERMAEILLVSLPQNRFFQQHRDRLEAAHAIAWNAWTDSNWLTRGDAVDKIYAHVLRDAINEVLPLVALLAGDYKRMHQVSHAMRRLFRKPLTEQ